MTQDSYRADGFHTARIEVLQPSLSMSDLVEDQMVTEDPYYFACLTNLLRTWSQSRHDLPTDFAEEVDLLRVTRQPLALASLEIQHLERKVSNVYEPYRGQTIDESDWPTEDLFKLLDFESTLFPTEAFEVRDPIPGRQSIENCDLCSGNGFTNCFTCEGAGQVVCPTCEGAREVACSQCSGAGMHFGVSGRMVQCRTCYGRGVRKCKACTKGVVRCVECVDGQIMCDKCQRQGKLKKSWMMHSRIFTKNYQAFWMSGICPVDVEILHADSDDIFCQAWASPLEFYPSTPLPQDVPSGLGAEIRKLLHQGLESGDQPIATSSRKPTGARVRIGGTYVYQVDFSFHEQERRIYVAGSSNRVFTLGAFEKRSVAKKLARAGLRLLNKMIGIESSDLAPDFDKAIRGGNTHVADSRCLVPEAAKIIGMLITVTEDGYRLDHFNEGIACDVTFSTDAHNELILCLKHVLGPANRQRYAQALSSCSRVPFGRVAVNQDKKTGDTYFEYVERRLYKLTKPQHLAHILKAMSQEAGDLRREIVMS